MIKKNAALYKDMDGKSYKFGEKNQWRRWIWNRLSERVQDKSKSVLYLASAECLDYEVARSKGFRNLVAVNSDESVCRTIRKMGRKAIAGDLNSVIRAWPDDLPIGAVLADFCSGITSYSKDTLSEIAIGPTGNTDGVVAVAMNFLRGRDAETNFVREEYRLAGETDALFLKNRAWMYLDTCVDNLAFSFQERSHELISYKRLKQQFWDAINPELYSYRSGNLVMDSFVISLQVYEDSKNRYQD